MFDFLIQTIQTEIGRQVKALPFKFHEGKEVRCSLCPARFVFEITDLCFIPNKDPFKPDEMGILCPDCRNTCARGREIAW